MAGDTLELLGVAAACASACAAVMVPVGIYVHGRYVKQIDALRERIEEAEDKATREHKQVAAQITDMMQEVAENYVRKTDLESLIRDLRSDISDVNRNIGKVGERVDELFRSVAWRRQA